MKINWGTGIVLAFIGFIAFILYFVVRMSTDDRANHDLVTEEYYKKELSYQQEIDASKSASEAGVELKVEKTVEGLVIEFPEQFDPEKITGTVSLYRPSNKHLDSNFPISLSKTHLLIPDNRLVDGRWDISIIWEYEGKPFLHKQKLVY
ncbi:FixH family protein [Flagellimonas zhangzhouensis]|uniref:FixH protein n=1 Tax=Flagellimonas zhangzhouensis TaxID=1073328 RepID=A0A1H2WSC2_9FLAO|nr:FixH family protein [Allomuricauda zhangzhouensis]SDQ24356.1 FixH protein [Allomuricauda zhangzhouensis]SDW83573.1 FixH protein [Allomuricauda zhangzhouensis]